MLRKTLTMLSLALMLAPTGWAAETFAVDPGHSEAGFTVRHLLTKVHGRFTDFAGTIQVDRDKPESSSVEINIKTASVDTANPNRDKDLRSANFFEVEKFPEMTFKSSKIVAKAKDQFDVAGTLTMRGVAKEITLPVTFLGFAKDPWGGDRAGFEATVTINRKDFGIVWNKLLDNGQLFVSDEVSVNFNIEAMKPRPVPAK